MTWVLCVSGTCGQQSTAPYKGLAETVLRPLDWAQGLPEGWSDRILGVSGRVFVHELSLHICGLSKQMALPGVGGPCPM